VGSPLKDERGFALILTILIISLIVALTLDFNRSMRSDLYAAANFKDGIQLGCIARSGINGALAILLGDAQDNNFDSLLEDWANLEALSVHSSSIFDEGSFEVHVIDQTGRIQINKLVVQEGENKGKFNAGQKDLLKRFLSSDQFGLGTENVDDIIDAIKDWIDPDNEATGFGGAESDYYQSLEVPYSCRNAPLESRRELLLVKGITKEIFYGTKDKPGISDFLTAYGAGKVNINTADPMVLNALSDQLDQDMVEKMIEYREDERNDLSKVEWYKTALGTNEDIIEPDLITTSSTYFEIRSEGIKGTMTKRVTAMVEREPGYGKIKVLSWRIE